MNKISKSRTIFGNEIEKIPLLIKRQDTIQKFSLESEGPERIELNKY